MTANLAKLEQISIMISPLLFYRKSLEIDLINSHGKFLKKNEVRNTTGAKLGTLIGPLKKRNFRQLAAMSSLWH